MFLYRVRTYLTKNYLPLIFLFERDVNCLVSLFKRLGIYLVSLLTHPQCIDSKLIFIVNFAAFRFELAANGSLLLLHIEDWRLGKGRMRGRTRLLFDKFKSLSGFSLSRYPEILFKCNAFVVEFGGSLSISLVFALTVRAELQLRQARAHG